MDEKIKLIWRPKAWAKVELIYAHHAAISQQGANRLLRRIFEAADTLATFPMSGKIEPYLQHIEGSYRSIVADKRYKLIYTVEEDDAFIVIHDVWPCKRDPRCMSSFIFNR